MANKSLIIVLLLLVYACGRSDTSKQNEKKEANNKRPNVIFILSDDMGYGDPIVYNPESKIPTPNIDKLASEGMLFTDAHAAGAWCTPSRFGFVTGRYPLDRDMDWTKGSLVNGLITIGSVMKDKGYVTGAIGKWHLGFDNTGDWDNFDYQKPINGGPVDHGFDYFFGIHASLDMGPYFYIYNRHAVETPTDSTPGHHSDYVTKPKRKKSGRVFFGTKARINSVQGALWRPGKIAPHFKFEQVTPTLTDSALAFIDREARSDKPFFLYYAMTSPHTPWVPLEQFQDKSGAGPYGDFVMEVDYEVGRIVEKLKELGIQNNTLLIFTSDNGPVWFKRDVERYHHRSSYIYRGMKADSWEGGHRIPFIASWAGKIKEGSVSHALISFTDMLATFAHIAGDILTAGQSRDSYNLLPVLLGQGPSGRKDMVEQANTIRQNNWKLIFGSGMGNLHGNYGDEDYAKYKKIKGELYNLTNDPSEKDNLYREYPKKVEHLDSLMEVIKKYEYQ